MTDPADYPVLFLDVDGTLLPYGGARLPSRAEEWDGWQDMSNPQLAKLDRSHGRRLLALPCRLLWATAWMEEANEVIAPLLGLPELPVVDLPDETDEVMGGLHWKTQALVETACGSPFVWLDDEITERDRSWVSSHYPGEALLHRVDPITGLTDDDFSAIETWLRTPR